MSDFTNNEDWLRSLFVDEAKEENTNSEKSENETLPIISLTDDDGIEHVFEELDVLFYNDKEYVALLPVSNNPSGLFFNEQIAILIRSYDYDDEIYLETIDDSDEFTLIRNMFEDRLADLF